MLFVELCVPSKLELGSGACITGRELELDGLRGLLHGLRGLLHGLLHGLRALEQRGLDWIALEHYSLLLGLREQCLGLRILLGVPALHGNLHALLLELRVRADAVAAAAVITVGGVFQERVGGLKHRGVGKASDVAGGESSCGRGVSVANRHVRGFVGVAENCVEGGHRAPGTVVGILLASDSHVLLRRWLHPGLVVAQALGNREVRELEVV